MLLWTMYFIMCASGQEFTLVHDGLMRSYRLHLPSGYNQGSVYPLVINMHGLGSNALEQEFYTAFNQVSDTAGIVVAYPNAIGGSWNIASTTGVDDVGFISALIDTLDADYSIDLNKVYATGMSMGGFMSYRLACELSDRIAAIASVTGLHVFFPCSPGRPVPVMQVHGNADPVVPYSGVAATISHWVNYNACPSVPVITNLPDIDTTDNSTVTVSYYAPCDDSTEVILYTINGGEHTWPGAQFIIGVTNQDIKASGEIWKFYRNYSLQSASAVGEGVDQKTIYLSMYPNPASQYATFEIRAEITGHGVLRIYDTAGKMVYVKDVTVPGRYLFERGTLHAGIYIAEIAINKGIYRTKIALQ